MKSKLVYLPLLFLGLAFPAIASASDVRPIDIVNIETTIDATSSLATAPNGDIWVADWSVDRVQLFSKDATGSSAPLKTITLYASGGNPSGSSAASSVAVDTNGFLYVVDASALKIYVFNPALSDNQFVGDATRVINLGRRAESIALDSSGKIYVAGQYNLKLEVRVYEAGTTAGSSTPLRTFIDLAVNDARQPYGLTILPNGQIAISWYRYSYIKIYDAEASGDVNPVRTISGSATNLGYNAQVISDSLGRLYVYSTGSNTIQIFAPEADGDAAPIASIGLYEVSGPSLIPAVVASGWGLTLGSDSQIWIGDEFRLVHFDNPFTIEDVAQTPALNPTVDRAVAEEMRRQAIAAAKSDVRNTLASGKPLTADQLLKADFNGVTTKNIASINEEIAKLSDADKSDIRTIEKIVFKYAIVDKVASGSNFYSADLISVGLISPDSKNKAGILAELKRLPEAAVDSYTEIQEAITSYEETVSVRKARLAALLARKISRDVVTGRL